MIPFAPLSASGMATAPSAPPRLHHLWTGEEGKGTEKLKTRGGKREVEKEKRRKGGGERDGCPQVQLCGFRSDYTIGDS